MDAICTFPPTLVVYRARTFLSRLAGLLARPQLHEGEALVLTPCRSVHTWFMTYRIDVVFIDRAGRVLAAHHDVVPWRVVSCPGAHAALELRSGEASRHGFARGTSLSAGLSGTAP